MELNLKYTSPSVFRLKGFTVEEALSRSVEEALTPRSQEEVLDLFEREMAYEATGDADHPSGPGGRTCNGSVLFFILFCILRRQAREGAPAQKRLKTRAMSRPGAV